jgi:hypothetical protein
MKRAAFVLLTVLPLLVLPALVEAQQRTPRRPSMVGYVEDATIRSQVRLRLDAASGTRSPDRAEFFYAKCGCYQVFEPPLRDLEAPGPGPGALYSLSYLQFLLQADYAVAERVGLFAEVGIRSVSPDKFVELGPSAAPFDGQTGLGDMKVGAKVALLLDEDQALTLQVRAGIPTGDPAKGLGNNNASIEPMLLFSTQVGPRWGIESQVGYYHPLGGSDPVPGTSADRFSGSILYYGLGPSFDAWENDRFRLSPVFEVVGWHVLGGNQTSCRNSVCASEDADSNIVNAKLGARLAAGDRHSFYLGYGVALTSASWYRSVVRAEYRVIP